MIDIRYVRGHYEAFCDGRFVVSADTLEELHTFLREEEEEDGMG